VTRPRAGNGPSGSIAFGWPLAALGLALATVIVVVTIIMEIEKKSAHDIKSFIAAAVPTAIVALLATAATHDWLVAAGALKKGFKVTTYQSPYFPPVVVVPVGLLIGGIFGWYAWQ
jgi:hypothetical protein